MEVILSAAVVILLCVVAWIDWRTMEIPDELNLALAFCGLIAMFTEPEISIPARLLGAICVSGPMYLMILLIPDSFGGGDVKLTFGMGLYLGWKRMLVGTFLAFLIGGTQALLLLATGKARAGDGAHMAFGPALCVGFLIAGFYGNELLNWYLNLVF